MTRRQVPLATVQRTIRACTRCVEAGFIERAASILRGNASASIMVIGQAPGPTAFERPWPYSGATGKTLQSWIERAGFEPGDLHDPDRFYLTSLTKCFPGKAASGAGDRAPRRAEIELCSSHLQAELAYVKPELILALGRLSIGRMAPSTRKITLFDLVGSPVAAEYPPAIPAIVLPLPHPSGVSRWLNADVNRARLWLAIEWLAAERIARGW